ncbi:cytoplasmic protein [Bacillus cereus]|uniref:YwqG family protein n=1 Tax=Bacillus paramycoides TaxID=2026194 RepID=UPI000BF7420B|nr:DUF1963 domain-containing protein [Bacillus paramycoides]PFD41959.1 cytoplasmic protein [Bacillus cereus]
MKNTYQLKIPKELERYRSGFEDSVKPYIKVFGTQAETTLFESKFGGYPYLPLKLQFFISAEDELFGADFEQPTTQKDFRIIYHLEITQDSTKIITDFSYLNTLNLEEFIIPEAAKLTFELDYQPVSARDYRFEKIFQDNIYLEKIINDKNEILELSDLYDEHYDGEGHKIGGYPFLTQTNPRDWGEELLEHNVLLLQIDTDDALNIMWGDADVANFFIREKDLINLDFSNVVYN